MAGMSAVLHGHRVSYKEMGDPDLPTVLLIHGITSSSATWDPVLPALSKHAHVIAPDLLGHGESDKPRTDYSLGGFASLLRDLLEHLGRERATIVGHSLGGGVAMQFAYQYHDRCERLVLVDSGGLGREVSWYLRAGTVPGAELVMPLIANKYVLHAGQAAHRALSRLPVRQLRPSSIEVFRGYTVLAESPARSAFVHTLRSVVEPGGQRVNATDKLYLAQGRPSLIVWGALDTVIPVKHAYEAHAALPGSQLEVFEQSEHFPHMDEPARFARVLIEFLNSTESGAIDRETVRERISAQSNAAVQGVGSEAETARVTAAQVAGDEVRGQQSSDDQVPAIRS